MLHKKRLTRMAKEVAEVATVECFFTHLSTRMRKKPWVIGWVNLK